MSSQAAVTNGNVIDDLPFVLEGTFSHWISPPESGLIFIGSDTVALVSFSAEFTSGDSGTWRGTIPYGTAEGGYSAILHSGAGFDVTATGSVDVPLIVSHTISHSNIPVNSSRVRANNFDKVMLAELLASGSVDWVSLRKKLVRLGIEPR